MSFWNIFKTDNDNKSRNELLTALESHLGERSEEDKLKITCVAGCLAHVAYVDFEITDDEINTIEATLIEWNKLSKEEASIVSNIAIKHIKEFASIESYLYTNELKDLMPEKEKYLLLQALFAVAASDGTTDNQESEAIRTLSHGLALDNNHFIAARATVLESLSVRK